MTDEQQLLHHLAQELRLLGLHVSEDYNAHFNSLNIVHHHTDYGIYYDQQLQELLFHPPNNRTTPIDLHNPNIYQELAHHIKSRIK